MVMFLPHYLLLVVSFILLTINGGKADATCRQGFEALNGVCYGLVQQKMTWANAEAHCKSLGAYLAEPRGRAENLFIKGLVFESTHGVWLGGTDHDTEGNWIWSSSQALMSESYSDWGAGQPNNANGHQDCLAMRHDARHWTDQMCP